MQTPVTQIPTPVAPQPTQSGSNVTFNPEEMMQQMRHTVESGMQAFMEKNKERAKSPPPHVEPPPTPVPTPIPIQHPPPDPALPPLPRLHRRSRSRSQRHHSGLDKRPVSIPRSPRREKPVSRPRHRRRHSNSRDRSRRPSHAPSVTLRSASPRRREVLRGRDDDFAGDDQSHRPTSLQPSSWDYQHYDPPTTSYKDDHDSNYSSYDQHSTNKWKSWNQWKDHSKASYYTHPSGWIDYPKSSYKHQSYNDPPSKHTSKPLTAFSSDHSTHGHGHHSRRSGSVQSRASTVPPGHIAINLQEGSKEEWARHIRHALHHPDRMRAANELASNERPEPSLSIVHAEYDEAMEQIHKVDSRLPPDIARKAVQLFFSTGLLPAYDLSNCHVRELPQTSMLALVMPLPDISRFQMPNPFGGQSNITWALCHGTTLRTSQLILMEGKIRPANWSYHPNPQRCHLPTFGAFYIGRQVSNADQDFPSWAEQELLDSMEKKGKGQQEITVGAMYRGSRDHLALKAGGNEKGQLNVIEKGIVTTPEKYTIAHSNHVGLKFIAIKWADLKSTDSSPRRPIDLRDTDSEDNVNYRTNEERHADRRRGWALKTALSARVLLAYVVLNRILHSFLGFTWTNALVKSASLFLFLLLFCEGFGFLVGLLSLVFFFFFWATFFWASCWKDHDR